MILTSSMRIACLGWGSLVWDRERQHLLPINSGWSQDGPLVHVEFLRQSANGTMTLVLDSSAPAVPSLWATLNVADLAIGKQALQRREGTNARHIGSWSKGGSVPTLILSLSEWAEKKNLDAVVWTALPPKFDNRDSVVPTEAEVIAYLDGLPEPKRKLAENYIRFAPKQIDTPYRRAIEAALRWSPLAPVLE